MGGEAVGHMAVRREKGHSGWGVPGSVGDRQPRPRPTADPAVTLPNKGTLTFLFFRKVKTIMG